MGRLHRKNSKHARSTSKALSDSALCDRDYQELDLDTAHIQGSKRGQLESSLARMSSAKSNKKFHKEMLKAKKLLAEAEDEEMISQTDYGTLRRSFSLKHERRVSKKELQRDRKVDREAKAFTKDVETDLVSLAMCGDCGKEHTNFPGLSCADSVNANISCTLEKWTDFRGYGNVWQPQDYSNLLDNLVIKKHNLMLAILDKKRDLAIMDKLPEWETREGWEPNHSGFYASPDWVEPEEVSENEYENFFADAAAVTAAETRYGEWEEREGWTLNKSGFMQSPDWQEPEEVDEEQYAGLFSDAAATAAAEKVYGEWEEREGWTRNEQGFFCAPDWVEPAKDETYSAIFYDASAVTAAEETYSSLDWNEAEAEVFARASAKKAADEIYKAAIEGATEWEEREGWSFRNGFYTAPNWVEREQEGKEETQEYFDDQESSVQYEENEPSAPYYDDQEENSYENHEQEESTPAWEDRSGWDYQGGYYTHWSWQQSDESEDEWAPSKGWDWAHEYSNDWATSDTDSETEQKPQYLVGGWESREGYELGADGFYRHWSWKEPVEEAEKDDSEGEQDIYYSERKNEESREAVLVGGWESREGYELSANGYYTHSSWVEPETQSSWVEPADDDEEDECEEDIYYSERKNEEEPVEEKGWEEREGYELKNGYFTHSSWIEPEEAVEEPCEEPVSAEWEDREGWSWRNGFYMSEDWVEPESVEDDEDKEWEQVEKPWEHREGWVLKENGYYTAPDWVDAETDDWEAVSCCSSEASWDDVDEIDFEKDYDGFAL